MAGRPPLRIGQHGKISRIDLGGGIWLARCRFRDDDGVVRIVERRSPVGERDQYGKGAEDTLVESLKNRNTAKSGAEITAKTTLAELNKVYLARLVEDDREIRTIDTYTSVSKRLLVALGSVRVGEAKLHLLNRTVRALRDRVGVTTAKQARTILRGMFAIAIEAEAITENPMRDVQAPARKKGAEPKASKAIDTDVLIQLLRDVYTSELPIDDDAKNPRSVAQYCADVDLADLIVMYAATGLRRSELLAVRWVDIKTTKLSVTGKVVRAAGRGLVREDTGKTDSADRVIALPKFAIAMLDRRKLEPHPNDHGVVFPSTKGTLRDPDNTNAQWRKVRSPLGLDKVTSHSFRKTVATLIDDGGLSARIGADHLGHAKVSMTQDVYMARGRVHASVADLLDAAIGDE